MSNNSLKYYCDKCRALRAPALEKGPSPNSTIPVMIEVIQVNADGKKYRKLECLHWSAIDTPGLRELRPGEDQTLSEYETSDLRNMVDLEMVGLSPKEREQKILFLAEEYQLKKKVLNKQQKQIKYLEMYLEQFMERHSATLTDATEHQNFLTRWAHHREIKPSSNKMLERQQANMEREVKKERTEKIEKENTVDKMKKRLAQTSFKTGLSKEELIAHLQALKNK